MALHIFTNRFQCVRLGMTKTARGHSTSLRQNTKAVCIGVAGRKILGFVTIRRKPASTISATAKGSGASTRAVRDRKSTRLNSSHTVISYAVFCLKKKKKKRKETQIQSDNTRSP